MVEELKRVVINNNKNQNSERKLSKSFDDTLPHKDKPRRNNNNSDPTCSLKYEFIKAAIDCLNCCNLLRRHSSLRNNGFPYTVFRCIWCSSSYKCEKIYFVKTKHDDHLAVWFNDTLAVIWNNQPKFLLGKSSGIFPMNMF
jgi:hypothetical protein